MPRTERESDQWSKPAPISEWGTPRPPRGGGRPRPHGRHAGPGGEVRRRDAGRRCRRRRSDRLRQARHRQRGPGAPGEDRDHRDRLRLPPAGSACPRRTPSARPATASSSATAASWSPAATPPRRRPPSSPSPRLSASLERGVPPCPPGHRRTPPLHPARDVHRRPPRSGGDRAWTRLDAHGPSRRLRRGRPRRPHLPPGHHRRRLRMRRSAGRRALPRNARGHGEAHRSRPGLRGRLTTPVSFFSVAAPG